MAEALKPGPIAEYARRWSLDKRTVCGLRAVNEEIAKHCGEPALVCWQGQVNEVHRFGRGYDKNVQRFSAMGILSKPHLVFYDDGATCVIPMTHHLSSQAIVLLDLSVARPGAFMDKPPLLGCPQLRLSGAPSEQRETGVMYASIGTEAVLARFVHGRENGHEIFESCVSKLLRSNR